MNIKNFFKKILRKNGKIDFLYNLPEHSKILDVGCGNNSPFTVKTILPRCHYTGLDIGNYNQTKPNIADSYIITSPENFSSEIYSLKNSFDIVISSHNIEHCNDREGTLDAMLKALKINGRIYLSFPSEESVNFPKRKGTLNYYDDSTHLSSPPNFKEFLKIIEKAGFEIEYENKSYSPFILKLIGWFLEPISKIRKKIMPGTWDYYGFESIIIAKKII